MTTPSLQSMKGRIREASLHHGVRTVHAFGSYVRGNATVESDLDLLVELEPGRDLLDLVGMKQELEASLGLRVDVVTKDSLSPHLRTRILKEAQKL